jgi:hypothetical protein
VQNRIVRELDAVADASGVEDLDVITALGIVDDLGDLEPPGIDPLAVIRPDCGGIVERFLLGWDLELQVEPDRGLGEALGEL